MKEYRVKGMSCGGCALRMEQEIRELQHGEDATLSYNSGKLTVSEDISLDAVCRILKSDGATIAPPPPASWGNRGQSEHHHHAGHNHDHGLETSRADHAEEENGHDHSHGGGGFGKLKPVIAATVLYVVGLLGDGRAEPFVVVLLYLAATAISGSPTFMKGLRNLLRLRFTMDTLMTVALVGAVAIGEWKEATLVAILFGLNEWLEGLGMEKARRSMDALLKTAPKEALKVESDGRESIVPIEALATGDVVKIKPGDQIPSDGEVLQGVGSVNEAAITGESLPLRKEPGDAVLGGSLNQDGLLLLRITKAYRDSSLARILHLVQEAQETKTPTELFINKFARYYTPAVMIAAVIVMLAPPLLFGGDWLKWLYQGLSVLIVGCPCALILASPIAIVSGIARMARHGILVKGGVHLEQLGKLELLAFDKTGTLTKGRPRVTEVRVYDEERLFRIASLIESGSSHPLAAAVLEETVRRGIAPGSSPAAVRNIAGVGMEAFIDGIAYRLGNEQSAAHLALPLHVRNDIDALKSAGLTLAIVSDETEVLGLFGMEDELREESADVVAELRGLGIRKTVMLTGDHEQTARKIANRVGVTEARSGLMPADKVAAIREMAAHGPVGMVGDGVNDAPALAAATLGIAMGKGTDSAMETADIVLMQDHLGKLPYAVKIARHAGRIIRVNIAIALGLKLIALLLTIPGWLTLWIAILSDMGATILVTLIGLTMFLERKQE